MKLDAKKFALAGAITAGILYIVCAIVVILFPETAIKLVSVLFHVLDFGKFTGEMVVTAGGLIIGTVEVVVYVFVGLYIFSLLYNRMTK